MSVQMILLPLFVQVLLTIALGLHLAVRRRVALARGHALAGHRHARAELAEGCDRRATMRISNQFEMPVLFYVLTILALITKQADLLFVMMAWIFVVMRILQAGVFVTSNHVPIRGAFFGIGFIVLVIMWILFIIRILAQ